MISCDLTVSKIPPLENYVLLLNTGLNIATIQDSTRKQEFYWQRTYNNKTEEAFQYMLTSGEDKVKRPSTCTPFSIYRCFPCL